MSLHRTRFDLALALLTTLVAVTLSAQPALAGNSNAIGGVSARLLSSPDKVSPALSPGKPNRIFTVAAARPTKEVFGFALASSLADPTIGYPSWDFNMLSTVAYFGLHVDAAGQFASDNGWNVWNSSTLTNLLSLAHQHGVKVVLTIILQDFSSNTPNMCAGLAHTGVTVSATAREVAAKGVDGVNIDYEGLNGSCGTADPNWAQHAMNSFAKQLRDALGSSSYISIDTYAGAASDPYGFFDIVGLTASVDSFFVMAYDLEYSNYARPPAGCSSFCLGPTSPLTSYYYNDTRVMSQYAAVTPPGKVIFGVPYYGRKSCVASATANQYPTSSVVADSYLDASGESAYFEVQAGSYVIHRETNSAGSERWDTWYNTALNCIRELYWDDAVSLGKKYDLVNANGLRGVGIWNLNYGGGAPELWAALTNHFGPCTAPTITASPTSPQGTGTPITVTATATVCASPQYRFWVQPPGGAWSIAQDYGASSTFNWTATGPAGGYRLEVDVRANSSVAYDAVAQLSYALEQCASATLTTDKASPQPPGTTVLLTGVATCRGTPQYRFWTRSPGGTWTIVQDYGASSTYSWNTTGGQAGTYGVEVDVRNQGSTSTYEAVANLGYLLDACSAARLTADRTSPQPPGPTILLTGTATCAGTPQYRFWVRPPSGAWTIVQDYSATSTYSWNTTGKPSGAYGLEVDVRDAGSTAAYDTVANLAYLVDACSAARLTADKASPQPPGTNVLLTGAATCAGTPQYRFWTRSPGGTWTITQDYSATGTYSWNTPAAPGVYGLEVDVRNQGSTATYETVANLNYLGAGCTAARLTADKAAPQPPGTTVLLTGAATCAGTPQYRFWVRAPGSAWTVVQDYSAAGTYSWSTTGPKGTYGLEVDVREAGSTVAYDTVANLTYLVDICSAARLSTDKASPQAPGTTILLTGAATCGGTPEYRFWVRAPSGAWTIVQDYSATGTYSWNTTGKPAGTYGLEVDVRDQGASAVYDTVANLTFVIGP